MFATLSRRIRNSNNWNSKLSQDNLKILIAGKALNDHDDLTFVNIKDRGGLWKVRPEVCKIFSVAELLFKSVCNGFVRCIGSKKMVEKLLVNAEVLTNYSNICSDISDVEKEIALNLLEHMLTLYIRLRSFSYAKDKVQTHRILAKRQKSRSLRTEMKKSSKLNQRH